MAMRIQKLVAIAALTIAPAVSSAFTIYDNFGPFPNANFGGTGIPNNAVAVSKSIFDNATGSTITIAMNATQRFTNPVVTNDGFATYFAGPGSNIQGPNNTLGALWNWNYYLEVASPSKTLKDFQIDIWYDFNPASSPNLGDLSGMGRINVTAGLLAASSNATLAQGSENLLFSYLTSPPFPQSLFITPPSGTFNPNAPGNYQFAITVNRFGFPIDSVAMEVQVIPVPAAVWLFGSALGLMGVLRRRAKA